MQSDKGECAQVAKCLIRGEDDDQADPCGHPQRVRRSQAHVQLLKKEGGGTLMGGRINRSLASRVEGGVQQAHVFDKHGQGEEGAEMRPASKDPVTRPVSGWRALPSCLIPGRPTPKCGGGPHPLPPRTKLGAGGKVS